jgi:carbamoyl-phosphate synthase large subunit
MSVDNRINVLVTGVGGGGVGEQILKSLKLSTLPLRVAGTDVTPISKGAVGLEKFAVLPLASDSSYMKVLLECCSEHAIQVVFPGSEPELKVMVKHREEIDKAGIFLSANTSEVIDICLDKFRTAKFLESHGFKQPLSCQIRVLEDCDAVTTFPVVLKPSVGGGGSANTYIVQTLEELRFSTSQMLSMYEEFICQEYLGTPDDEYTVGILSDLDGKLVNSIALHRTIAHGLGCKINVPNRTMRKELGSRLVISSGISQGHIGKYPEVTRVCEKIAETIGSKGPLNVQCRLVNGEVYVFEINPRHSGTTAMRAMVGFNEPELMIRMGCLKESVKRNFPFNEGWVLRGLEETLVSAIKVATE